MEAIAGVIDFFARYSCFASREQASPTAEHPNSCRKCLSPEAAAQFLGCSSDAKALRCVCLAQLSQVCYASCSESMNVVLPRINLELGGDITSFAHLQAVTNLLQAGGGIMFGRFTDRFGPKSALLLAHTGALTSSMVFASAGSVPVFFLGSLPLLAKHGYQAAQQVATLHSSRELRSTALGRIGSAYGIGFLFGSLAITKIAQHVSSRGIALGTVAVDIGMMTVIALAYPDADHESACTTTMSRNSGEEWEMTGVGSVIRRKHVSTLLCFKTAATASAGMILNMMQQFAIHPFGLSIANSALMTTYTGCVYLAAQAAVAPAIGPMPLHLLILCSSASIGLALASFALQPILLGTSGFAYAILLGPLVIASHASNVVMTSTLTVMVPEKEQGLVLGLSMATTSVGYLLAPLASALVFNTWGFAAVPLAGISVLALTTSVLMVFDPFWQGGQSCIED